jgi:hypothetical protein
MEVTLICGYTFSSVTFVQAFMLRMGLNSTNIGTIGFIGQLFVIAGYLIFIGDASRGRQIQRRYCYTVLFNGLIPVILIFIGIFMYKSGSYDLTLVLMILIAATSIQNILVAYSIILTAKIIIKVIDVKYVGQLFGLSGVIGNLLGAAVSLISTIFMQKNGYPGGFYLVFAISVIFFIINAFVALRLRIIYNKDEEGNKIDEYIERKNRIPVLNFKKLWGNLQIRSLFLPNVLRGIGLAGPYYIMTIGKKNLDLPVVYSNYIATAIIFGTVLGNIIFSFAINRFPTGKVVFAGTVLSALSLILLCISGSPVLFLILNFVLVAGQIQVDTGVPTGMYRNMPESMLGAVTGIRMLLMSVGAALSILAGGYILDHFSVLPFILVLVAAQITSSLLFYKVLAK